VGEQVVTILAGSAGLLDEIAVGSITAFATDLLRWLNERHPDIVREIDQTGKLSDELAEKIAERVKEFKSTYRGK